MSIKRNAVVAGATLALVGGVSGLTAGTAGAATPSCGNGCVDLFSLEFGHHSSPNYVMDVWRQAAKVGQPVILFRTSDTDPAEDFTLEGQGTVSDFRAAGLVSQAVALHYGGGCEVPGPTPSPTPSLAPTVVPEAVSAPPCAVFYPDDEAFEFEYAPYGVDSGLCPGVARTAASNEGVTLQPCGVSSRTVWIADTADSPATLASEYVPLINASDTNFSHPFVLTYPGNGYPTDVPRPQLRVNNITGFSSGPGPVLGSVDDSQLWGADFGVLR
jgi:hypothetical protein